VAAHKMLDEMLAKFRGSVLAFSGENFARVAAECEKYKCELEKEREERKIQERLIKSLQEQVQRLQAENAELRLGREDAVASSTPAPSRVHSTSGLRPSDIQPGAKPATPAAADPAPTTTQVNMQSRMPCAPQVRQAMALCDEISLLVPRISKVCEVLYLARVVRDLKRLVSTPYGDPFEFSKGLTFDPKAGEGSNVSFEDEKMLSLRRAIPDGFIKVREWCVHTLMDGIVIPALYPATGLRVQRLVELLKDVSRNLRTSVMS